MDLRAAALDYAGRGWHILPLRGKVPLTRLAERGYLSASSDPRVVERWWGAAPQANIGLACKPSGVLVLDVDPRSEGDDTLHEMERELGEIPTTPRAQSGSGGEHVFLRHPAFRVTASLGPGLDVKSEGYVVLAPSVHPSTGALYEWDVTPEDAPLAEIPPSWAAVLRVRKRDPAHRTTGPIPASQRNRMLTSLAGGMRRLGFGPAEIEGALTVTNRQRCQPPLASSEVASVVRSSARWEIGPPWVTDIRTFLDDPRLTSTQLHLLTVLALNANDTGRVRGGLWLRSRTALSGSAVSSAVRALERHARIKVIRKPKEPNVYFLQTLNLPQAPSLRAQDATPV